MKTTSIYSKYCLVLFSLFFLLSNSKYSNGQASTGSGSASVFRAGASISNVTPSLGKGIVGNFGTPPPATHVHDQLNVRSLALDDGTTQLVWVVVDNVAIKRELFDEAKRQIHERTGVPVEHLMMSSTHTHSCVGAGGGPNGDDLGWCNWGEGKELVGYQVFLVERIVDGVQIALNNLEPAKIGWGSGQVPQHLFNRRWKMKTPVINPFGKMDKVKMNPGIANPDLVEPAGPTDPEVSFIAVQSKEGRPIALFANYSLHYVGGVPQGHLSADYYGFFANRIQELVGADRQDRAFVGIMSNGTSGDVNNINFEGPVEKYAPYEKMRLVADDVAEEVFRVYQKIPYHSWVRLNAIQSEIMLEVRRANPEMLAQAQTLQLKSEAEKPIFHPLEKVFAESVLQMEKEWPDQVSIILQTFSIGDMAVTAIPFEVFTETGLKIKDKSPFKNTFTVGLANGWGGYLPTPEQHQLGGYETWLTVNKVEKEASNKITDELLSQLQKQK